MIQPQSIVLNGLSRLSRSEVLEAAGLSEPVNFITFRSAKVVSNLKILPWIEKVEISQTFPNGLKISVDEYEPKGIVNLEYLYYIDANGKPFKKLDPGELSDLPIINGFSIDDLSESGPLVHDALNEVFTLVSVLAERNDEFSLPNISEFHYDPDRGITLFTKKTGIEIKVGFGGYLKKFWRLEKVMSHLKNNDLTIGLAYINLDYPMRVTVSYQGGRPQ
ncbi:MAG: FtsQ-type POTRA domain-containing protein [Deltaproteobacteria bacterium]|nr:FtsQ-type POTRA domain-containing protein [Deltaproteobacteria bacterium]